ncbi:MAG: hypothetical protein MUP85_19305, partial [Candidatus Lokiarchaeota archaeon]|nr:hypothetical protein [Candidatus Lokiarchaeota archaeon]
MRLFKNKLWVELSMAILILLISAFVINSYIADKDIKNEIEFLSNQASIFEKTSQYQKSIDHGNKILSIISYEEYPYEYGSTQNEIGEAYCSLAAFQDNEININMAINAHHEALTIFTNESYPIEYAKTQKDLGVAYYNLAEVRDKEENLNLALKASKEALNIYSREKYPVENADVQNILSQI